ncbi:MAG: hypothetical protein QOE29_1432 [Gaiellaceae bacterium]|jgi:nucleoside-diphosphate-sugar epimerase|nr:hypothetical protein [Gaiellaceae bacterium]
MRTAVTAGHVAERLAGRRVLLTGASGFIGSHVLRRLEDAGAEVHAVSRRPGPGGAGVRWWQVDLADWEETRALVEATRPEVILHLAGHPEGARALELVLPTFRSNLQSTVNLLSAAAETGAGRVVLTGSLEEPEAGAVEAVPSSPYAVSKWAAGAYGRLFEALFALPVVCLRVFMVYGPGTQDVRKVVPYSALALLRGEAPRLSSGRREVDWIYVEDVADAFLAAAVADGLSGATLDVGSGVLTSIRDVVTALQGLAGTGVEPAFGALPDRPLEQVRRADVPRTTECLGWRPAVELDEGLRRTVDWFRAELGAGRS